MIYIGLLGITLEFDIAKLIPLTVDLRLMT